MKLILLPGMDGTGMLFEPLLGELGELDTEVVPLPNSGPQDYASLAEVVANIIGERECVLLAESYAGGIAELLVRNYSLNINCDSGSGLASCILVRDTRPEPQVFSLNG